MRLAGAPPLAAPRPRRLHAGRSWRVRASAAAVSDTEGTWSVRRTPKHLMLQGSGVFNNFRNTPALRVCADSRVAAQIRGVEVYHRVLRPHAPAGLPVLVLHGGPQVPHDYLLPLSRLASAAAPRAVAFYDQPGCGRSGAPATPSDALYSVAGSVALLADVLPRMADVAGAGGVHLLGQSWGGVLALEYALAVGRDASLPRPASVAMATTPAEVPLLHAEVARLQAALPADVRETMQRHEAAGTTSSPEYAAALGAFYARHQCLIQPRPACVEAAFAKAGREWRGTGVIADWAAPRGEALARAWPPGLPALLLSGEADFVTPACVKPLADALPGARWALLRGASHMPHLEVPGAFDAELQAFWKKAEA